jgi:signal transduction histidine kinase
MLSHDLRQSRERIVTAREEERRRIRRDLHDGLGPALASLSLQVEIARDLITTDPARSSVLLDDVLAQTQESLLDIRRLVYDLRPPALDDLGLVGAIRAQVATWEQGGLTVVLDLPELPPLSAALEVAIFRIVQEALTNVVRHANATHATIAIAIQDDRLHLTITDDGNGLPGAYQPGVGMLSMGERAGELGGSCEIRTLPGGGVTVAASFALDSRLGSCQP